MPHAANCPNPDRIMVPGTICECGYIASELEELQISEARDRKAFSREEKFLIAEKHHALDASRRMFSHRKYISENPSNDWPKQSTLRTTLWSEISLKAGALGVKDVHELYPHRIRKNLSLYAGFFLSEDLRHSSELKRNIAAAVIRIEKILTDSLVWTHVLPSILPKLDRLIGKSEAQYIGYSYYDSNGSIFSINENDYLYGHETGVFFYPTFLWFDHTIPIERTVCPTLFKAPNRLNNELNLIDMVIGISHNSLLRETRMIGICDLFDLAITEEPLVHGNKVLTWLQTSWRRGKREFGIKEYIDPESPEILLDAQDTCNFEFQDAPLALGVAVLSLGIGLNFFQKENLTDSILVQNFIKDNLPYFFNPELRVPSPIKLSSCDYEIIRKTSSGKIKLISEDLIGKVKKK